MIKYYNHSYEEGSSQHSFLNFCRDNQLHNKVCDNNSSRLHSIYTQKDICIGIEAIIAEQENQPIGIAFVEKRDKNIIPVMNIELSQKAQAYNLGRVHFFVKQPYRNQGISQELSRLIEYQCLLKMMSTNINAQEFIPFFVAQEKALLIIKKNSIWTYAIECDGPSLLRQRELNKIKAQIDSSTETKKIFKDFFQNNYIQEYFSLNK